MDPNNPHFNTQNSSNNPFYNQNHNNYEDPNQISYQHPQNPTNYQVPHQLFNQRPQNPNYYQVPHQFSNQRPRNPNYYPDPNQYSYQPPQNIQNFNQSSIVPNSHPSYGSVRYSSQTPQSSGYMPVVPENVPSVDVAEFPEFSTQVNLGGGSADNEVNEITPKSKKAHLPAWNTAQNLVLISGWINCGTNSVVGRNQKGETFWRDIAEYCNEHCSFDPPRDWVACRNRWNYMNTRLGKWIGAYDSAKREHRSGWSEDDVIARAQELYASGKIGQFTLMEEWRVLHDQPRFCSQVGGNSGSRSSGSKRSHDSDASGSNSIGSIPRPMGREAAKKKSKKKIREDADEVVDKEWDSYIHFKEKELEKLEKIASVQAETNELMKEKTNAMKEKTNAKKVSMYLKLTSEEHLSDRKKELLEQLSKELFGN
ncbi:glutathione S-transferase T3-like [Lotus japonicus]|uniref:glutathione S-transferase T3-like n=1 Tax=Lotus japonicus TaxID=34305 RepID=UPI00258A1B1C|nr:glutathione S-transferase T3-like [Lotus japonicus]